MKNTRVRLTLGDLKLTEKNILKLELTSSVFLAGEVGSCSVVLNNYDDIYKLSTTGTLSMTDSFNDIKFWTTPLEFVVVDNYTMLQQNGIWTVSFSFINKYAAILLSTGFNQSYKNRALKDILSDVLSQKLSIPNVNISDVTNQYYDNPIILAPNNSQFNFIKYLLVRANPINSDILLFFIEKNTANITLPHRKRVIDKLDMFLATRASTNFVESYTFTINPNITVLKNLQSKTEILGFDDTQVQSKDYNLKQTKLYTEIYDKYNNIIVTSNIGKSSQNLSSVLYTGEDDGNKVSSILSYLIGRLLFDAVVLEVKVISNNAYKIDNQLKVIFYKNLGQEIIDTTLSDTYYIMAIKRDFHISNTQLPGTEQTIVDEMTLTLVKYATKITAQ